MTMKHMKYVATIALTTCLSQGVVMATTDTTPPPSGKTAAQQMKEHADQQKKQAAADKASRDKVAAKLKEQAAEKKEHEGDFRKSLVAMRVRHTSERSALTATNKKAMEDLIAKQNGEIAAATKGHEEHMTQVGADHEAVAQKKIAKHLGPKTQ